MVSRHARNDTLAQAGTLHFVQQSCRAKSSIRNFAETRVVTSSIAFSCPIARPPKEHLDNRFLLRPSVVLSLPILKEVMARAIHDASPRQTGPFVAFNCSGIPDGLIVPDGLIDSELFGYGRGAFTVANNGGKKGLIEEANGGTLFLDEIGDMPLAAQAKSLRVLQGYEVRRLGENQSYKVDVRIAFAPIDGDGRSIGKPT